MKQHVAFSDWLLALSNLSYVSFVSFCVLIAHFFLLLNTIPLSGCTMMCLFIHQWNDCFRFGHLNILCRCLCGRNFPLLWVTAGGQSLGHIECSALEKGRPSEVLLPQQGGECPAHVRGGLGATPWSPVGCGRSVHYADVSGFIYPVSSSCAFTTQFFEFCEQRAVEPSAMVAAC